MKLVLSFIALIISFNTYAREVSLSTQNTVILDRDTDYLTIDLFVPAAIAKRMFLPEKETLYILVVSPGGNAGAALQLLKIIDSIPNTAIICKYCASGAGMIFAAADIPRLAISKSIAVMHEMYIPKLTANMARNKANIEGLIQDSERFDKIIYTSIKMSQKEYQDRINGKEWTVKGKELVDFHIADELITIKCNDRLKLIAPDTCSQ